MDPDFGWHIQAGNFILHHGIPYLDPFSYSMPSYPFVDHEWLTNVLWMLLFTNFGFIPLLVLSLTLTLVSLLLQTIHVGKKWVVLPLFLAAGTFADFVGVRTQVLTWFFLSLLLFILNLRNKKWYFFLPLLFLIWANMHGGFGIGLGVLLIILIGRSLEEKKEMRTNLLIGFLCLIATLINPFGLRLWGEFLMQLSDTNLRWSINEWHPAFYFTNLAFWSYFAISVVLVIRYWRKYTKTVLFLYFFMLIEGLSSMRNIPIWILVSFVPTVKAITFLVKDAATYAHGEKRFQIAYNVFFVITICAFLPQLGTYFYDVYTAQLTERFPVQAVGYLRSHLPKQQIFSSYDWGGYLLWQLPEKKVFIDGRMPSWRWHANIQGESNYAFEEYEKVLKGEIPFASFVEKYHIDTLLIPAFALHKPEMKILGMPVEKDSFLQKVFLFDLTFYEVVQQAKKLGWKEVYRDQTAVVFEKQ